MQSFKPSLLLSLYRVSLQFFASSTTVQSATCRTRRRVIKLLHKNAPYLQYRPYTSKHSVSYRLILAPGCSISWAEACLQINFPWNGSLFVYCQSRFLSGIESTLHDFFSRLSIFIFSIFFFLESAIAYCLLIASFVARSLSWTLSGDQLSCKISAFFCAIKCSRVKTFHCAKWHKLSVYMLGFRCKSLLVG
jgi:hypothetical protein